MLLRCSILLSNLDMENTRAKKESSERLREQGMCVAAMKMEKRLCHHPNFLVSVWTRAYYTEVQSDPSENKHINLRNRKKIIIPAFGFVKEHILWNLFLSDIFISSVVLFFITDS